MRNGIKALLEADTTLMAILTGGLHTATEISRQDTPAAFDTNGEIKPCGLLKLESLAPTGPYDHSARMTLSIYLYQRSGYSSIESARERIYVLLHRQCVRPSAGACWAIEHSYDVLDVEDTALGCSLAVTTFQAIVRRA